jgi:hypothetical protein
MLPPATRIPAPPALIFAPRLQVQEHEQPPQLLNLTLKHHQEDGVQEIIYQAEHNIPEHSNIRQNVLEMLGAKNIQLPLFAIHPMMIEFKHMHLQKLTKLNGQPFQKADSKAYYALHHKISQGLYFNLKSIDYDTYNIPQTLKYEAESDKPYELFIKFNINETPLNPIDHVFYSLSFYQKHFSEKSSGAKSLCLLGQFKLSNGLAYTDTLNTLLDKESMIAKNFAGLYLNGVTSLKWPRSADDIVYFTRDYRAAAPENTARGATFKAEGFSLEIGLNY